MPGPPAELVEAVPPGGCLASHPCLLQPTALLLDAGGNVAASTATATLSAVPILAGINASTPPSATNAFAAASKAGSAAAFTLAVSASGGPLQFYGLGAPQPGYYVIVYRLVGAGSAVVAVVGEVFPVSGPPAQLAVIQQPGVCAFQHLKRRLKQCTLCVCIPCFKFVHLNRKGGQGVVDSMNRQRNIPLLETCIGCETQVY